MSDEVIKNLIKRIDNLVNLANEVGKILEIARLEIDDVIPINCRFSPSHSLNSPAEELVQIRAKREEILKIKERAFDKIFGLIGQNRSAKK